jgi:hypothetical protein
MYFGFYRGYMGLLLQIIAMHEATIECIKVALVM